MKYIFIKKSRPTNNESDEGHEWERKKIVSVRVSEKKGSGGNDGRKITRRLHRLETVTTIYI
jgi:hypothetical protein